MILTEEIFKQGQSIKGGWSMQQLRVLGVESTKNNSGWRSKLIGSDIDEYKVRRFIELKDSHLIGRKIFKSPKTKIGFIFCTENLTYNQQYLHPNWQKMRLYIFKRDSYKCVNCNNNQKTLHAHHLKYSRDKYIWEVPHWYLVTLCEDCHSAEHGRDLTISK